MKKIFWIVLIILGFVAENALAKEKKAVAKIQSASDSSVNGEIHFEQKGKEVTITVNLHRLSPGKHGFHIHEKGDCSAKDASSAGDHFNPTKTSHGGPDTASHHAGDFGNVIADEQGNVAVTITTQDITLGYGKHSVIGKSFIVHEKVDDLKSQPAGNAGKRIGCGVIEKVK